MRRLSKSPCRTTPGLPVPRGIGPPALRLTCLYLLATGIYLASAHGARTADSHESHLLPSRWSIKTQEHRPDDNVDKSGVLRRTLAGRTLLLLNEQPHSERNERARKQTFRLELLRQIKAIDHMKCFPKVLCGLSVDSDKSFGINKSNFVRSYLELMRTIKPNESSGDEEGDDDRIRTEDEVEDDLLWAFSPHNPDRKDHSSFERISSGGMSSSVEVSDSMESHRGRLDSLPSSEKLDRRGEVSIESKEKLKLAGSSSSSGGGRTEGSKIPGEKKQRNKSPGKSLTSKLSSYFTSWLPEIGSFGKKQQDEQEDSRESEFDDRSAARRLSNDDGKGSAGGIQDFLHSLPNDPVLHALIKRTRQSRADDSEIPASPGEPDTDDAPTGRDDIQADSAEHDADIYHTAVNIGKRLKDPKQCDYIYNGCPLDYNKILQMISSIKTEIKDDTAEAVSHELGLVSTPTSTTTTTTTTSTTTTTRRPVRRKGKPRPSTKIMHVLPNGEKVEINFRLAGTEESEESSGSGQRDSDKKELGSSGESSSEREEKGSSSSDDVMVVDVDQLSALSSEEYGSDKKISRKGSPPDVAVFRKPDKKHKVAYFGNSSNKNKFTSELIRNQDLRNEDLMMSYDQEHSSILSATVHNKQNKPNTIKLNGLSLTTNNDDQQLEISPSYVIIKHQPLSVHTTSVLGPSDNMQGQSVHHQTANDNLQTFQLMQGGHKIDPDQITDQLKNYIRQNGGLIPKLSLHSSGLITTDTNSQQQNSPFSIQTHRPSVSDIALSSISQKTHESFSNPLASLSLEPVSHSPFSSSGSLPFPHSAYSYSHHSSVVKGPQMVGAVPGRDSFVNKPKSSTTTSTTTTSTTTEKITFAGMAETITLDTDEITDDTVDKLSGGDSMPGWITPSPTSSAQENSKENDKQANLLENLNKSLLNNNNDPSKIRYKNPKKKKTRVKANSSRVRTSSQPQQQHSKSSNKGIRNKGWRGSGERVVIKHAGPYSSPTVYKSPLQGPGPHNGAYPYLPHNGGMKPSVFPGYPFWRM